MNNRFKPGCVVGAALVFAMFLYDEWNLQRMPTSKSSNCQHVTRIDDDYPEFLDHDPNPNYYDVDNLNHPNQIVHFGEFGFGHRLAKISSAWHLAKSLNVTRMRLFWGDCQDPTNLAAYLFGSDTIDVPGSDRIAIQAEKIGNVGKTIKLKNDVAGYYNGENFKKHKVVLPKKFGSGRSPFLDKYKSDVELYRILLKRFVGKGDVVKFMKDHEFKNHFVVGIHLRLGNGEQSHFKEAGREVDDEMEFVLHLVDLLKSFVDDLSNSHPERFIIDKCSKATKVPLFFLATDSPKYIPVISNHTREIGIDTIVMPQFRMEKGVTFSITKGNKCAQGWYDMLLDDIVLSFSDVLIAARYSTFTQSMPMPLIFDRAGGRRGPHFCEVGDTGTVMTCLEDMQTWLFRDAPQKIFTYSIGDGVDVKEVIHRMTVHLPDLETSSSFYRAVQFLNPVAESQTNMNDGQHRGWFYPVHKPRRTMTYGVDSLSWFDTKYRKAPICPSCTHFTFE
ncbi:hypothetical protein HJC23_000552 [Cyclotella cryptica]|uniref:Uncharacterized protein n=1 Tax=Cyclotella cryptica TaxID=29204 RepID=A0ABD3PTH8_9STRA|eukprot:CCRYP_011735-RA/>CCRYP_011735-RA protein AED:0.01 eAED:0.01 QI:49/1/1/1/1/1/2/2977/502